MEEIGNYAALLDLGKPDFIEIKGVTYCGSSGASSLTMQNVPYHADVCEFGEAICAARNGEYGLACEHAHSCCVLLARKDRFWKNGQWHTWIDYDKFQVRIASLFETAVLHLQDSCDLVHNKRKHKKRMNSKRDNAPAYALQNSHASTEKQVFFSVNCSMH